MARKKETKREIETFERAKFTFKLSSNGVRNRGITGTRCVAVACEFCGSVKLAGPDQQKVNKKNGLTRWFCDRECLGQYKKTQYLRPEYQARIRTGKRLLYDLLNKVRSSVKENQKTWRQKVLSTRKPIKKHERCCVICGAFFRTNYNTKVVCDNKLCSARFFWCKKGNRTDFGIIVCKQCGKEKFFSTHAKIRKFCSSKCMNKYAKNTRDERTKKACAFLHDAIDLQFFYDKQKGKCKICGLKTKMPNEKGADKTTATLDHIVPLSRGGWHIRSNMQMLCLSCNSIKEAKVEDGMQLMLPILEGQ